MYKYGAFFAALLLALILLPFGPRQQSLSPAEQAERDARCHSGRLDNAGVNQAMEDGHAIDPQYRCITRESVAAQQRAAVEREAYQRARAEELRVREQERLEEERRLAARTLPVARAQWRTRMHEAMNEQPSTPMPQPPAALFVPLKYRSQGLELTAFVSPDPGRGERLPLMIWLTGGDTNSLGEFWVPGPPSDDQSASAYREAGMLMMFPTLRGGNDNPGRREAFWGEVDDVLAALEAARRLPYVDPQRIYLGGHSTGATLALLVAASGASVNAVVALGPVADISGYGDLFGVSWRRLPREEVDLRSPAGWIRHVASPTWIVEGARSPSNVGELERLCGADMDNPLVHCLRAPGEDHFSLLAPLNQRLAAQIVVSGRVELSEEDFQ